MSSKETITFTTAGTSTLEIDAGADDTEIDESASESGSVVTVTSTDPVGYDLYIRAPFGTNMVGSSTNIPASSNTVAAPLSVNSWGYNTDGSSNFVGILTTPSLLKSAMGPFESGDNTTVTYGVLTDNITPEDSYSVSVTYTLVALND